MRSTDLFYYTEYYFSDNSKHVNFSAKQEQIDVDWENAEKNLDTAMNKDRSKHVDKWKRLEEQVKEQANKRNEGNKTPEDEAIAKKLLDMGKKIPLNQETCIYKAALADIATQIKKNGSGSRVHFDTKFYHPKMWSNASWDCFLKQTVVELSAAGVDCIFIASMATGLQGLFRVFSDKVGKKLISKEAVKILAEKAATSTASTTAEATSSAAAEVISHTAAFNIANTLYSVYDTYDLTDVVFGTEYLQMAKHYVNHKIDEFAKNNNEKELKLLKEYAINSQAMNAKDYLKGLDIEAQQKIAVNLLKEIGRIEEAEKLANEFKENPEQVKKDIDKIKAQKSATDSAKKAVKSKGVKIMYGIKNILETPVLRFMRAIKDPRIDTDIKPCRLHKVITEVLANFQNSQTNSVFLGGYTWKFFGNKENKNYERFEKWAKDGYRDGATLKDAAKVLYSMAPYIVKELGGKK